MNTDLKKNMIMRKRAITIVIAVCGIISQAAAQTNVTEIAFRNSDGGDDSDPYRMRKVQASSNNNWLELQLNDDSDESFRIYGNSCVGYNCTVYSGNLYHKFDVSGNVYHAGNVGIGTTSPVAKLEIAGSGGGNVNLKVNGRLQTGDASNSGGMWVNSATTMFMGQSGATSMGFYNNGAWRLVADNNGNVGIGALNPNQKLTVNGTIYGKEVKVDLSVPGPDYVFEKDYRLSSLEEIESYIQENKHLPEVPSAKEMEADGVNLSEMNMLLLKKIEELTLYVIEQKRELQELRNEIKK